MLPDLGSLRLITVLLPRGVRAFRYGRSSALVDVLHDFLLRVSGLLDDVVVGYGRLTSKGWIRFPPSRYLGGHSGPQLPAGWVRGAPKIGIQLCQCAILPIFSLLQQGPALARSEGSGLPV